MKNHSGFTLIEMMVTLAVGIILLAIGVPSFINMVSSNQAASYSNDVVGALRLARSEAVKRSSTVTICAGNNDLSGCSAGTWNNGWVVFDDANGDSV
ncbi:MAG: GspH/FimT family pseudopilin, partial [Candidatus Thiodiazotropha sp.]